MMFQAVNLCHYSVQVASCHVGMYRNFQVFPVGFTPSHILTVGSEICYDICEDTGICILVLGCKTAIN